MYEKYFKRIIDFFISFISIITFSPLLITLIITGTIFMKGNPFFVQKRPGKNEKIFNLIKFRTMLNYKDEYGDLLPDECRLNKYGFFLRSTSFDELPELFNILLGQMSLVGPRPLLVKDLIFMDSNIRRRHLVRPGLTGLAQINGRNIISWEDKFKFDIKYLENVTLINDLKIIIKTICVVIKRENVNRESTCSDIDYGDWLLKNNVITEIQYKNIMESLKHAKI